MTERLYYTDAFLTTFDAVVVSNETIDGRTGVVLDRTAFYPTSGGQPFDLGTLAGIPVVDVVDREDGVIVHVLDGAAPGGAVQGRIDWTRRFDHMQQHTGQHVLSAAIDRVLGVRTMSFHLGAVTSTIDLQRELTQAEIARAEEAANAVVWEDRPVTVTFAGPEDVTGLGLRKEPARTGRLRIVTVEDFDVSACGGTHVARTGSIGIIAVASWERVKGGTRLEFACGGRALRAFRTLRDIVDGSSRLLSVGGADLAAAIERVQNEAREGQRRVKALRESLAGHQAAEMAARAETVGTLRVVVEAVADVDAGGLKSIAQTICANPGHLAVLVTSIAPRGIAVARAADVTVDCGALLKQLTAALGGRGGGRPEGAQGGGIDADVPAIAAAVRRIVRADGRVVTARYN